MRRYNNIRNSYYTQAARQRLMGVPRDAVDIGELVEAAARRKILEETGLTVHSMRRNIQRGVLFTSDDCAGTLVPDHLESDEARFFPIDALPAPISPPRVRKVRDYARSRSLGAPDGRD